jgi:small-conductance mechanosensitive channel
MIAAIREAFAANDIKIPFPQRELSGRAETGGFRLADGEQPAADTPSRDVEPSRRTQPQSSEGEDDD